MDFQEFVLNEEKKDYYKPLMDFVDDEYENGTCFPKREEIFRAFQLTPLDKIKVVIIGQDPYHEVNQAHGLAFSVLSPKLPKSLINIYKEMEDDLGVKLNQDGNLEYLARQGVLLINTVLTVREGQADSHKNRGWEIFTDDLIKEINNIDRPIVFILWGKKAQAKEKLLNNPNHYIIKSEHPSPLSAYRGFFGSKPFSKTNAYLLEKGLSPIEWTK